MKKIILFVLATCLFACSPEVDEPANNNNVSLKTIDAVDINSGGVTLKGEINNVGLPLNYGFILATYQGGTYDNTYNFISRNGTFNGVYSMDMTDKFTKGQTYYYNAVAYANNEYIFGDEKTFVSNGNASPQIENVSPEIAHISDTITITGKSFSEVPEVFFDAVKANTIVKNDSLIKTIVPYGGNGIHPFTSIRVKKQTEEEDIFDGFSLYKPEVSAIEPSVAYETDALIIKGDHFDIQPTRNFLTMKVFSNEVRLEITSSSRTEIVVAGGVGAFYDLYPKFKLHSQHQTIEFDDKLRALMPTITGASDCLQYGKTATIYGTDFPRAGSSSFTTGLSVKLGNKLFAARAIYRDSIVLNINDDFYEDFTLKNVTINYLGEQIIYEKDICVDEPWIKVSLNNPSIPGSHQDEVYGVIYENNNTYVGVGKFNTSTYKFESVNGAQLPQDVRGGIMRIIHGRKLYHFNTSDVSNAFTSFDYFDNKLTELAPFPGENRINGFIIGVEDHIYFGLGGNVTNTLRKDLWKYSISNNTWEKVLDFPGIDSFANAKVSPLTFAIEGKIYIGAGQPSGYYSDFWEFDTATNELTSKENIPTPVSNVQKATHLNGKGYFENGLLYEYDPLSDTWKIYNDIKGIGFKYPGYGQSIFVHKGIIYRAISTSAPYYNLLYKLNPLYLN